MVCTSVTISQTKGTITNLQVVANPTQQGQATVTFNLDISSSITATVDNVTVNTSTYPAGAQTLYLGNLTVGSHQVCLTVN